jgi:hypothetical protein
VTCPTARDVLATLAFARRQLTVIEELYPKVHELAYSRRVTADVKVRINGADPTGELATSKHAERIRGDLEAAATALTGLLRLSKTASAALHRGFAVGMPEVRTTGARTWTGDDLDAAESEAWARRRRGGSS